MDWDFSRQLWRISHQWSNIGWYTAIIQGFGLCLVHGCSRITFLQCFNMRYEEPYYNPDKPNEDQNPSVSEFRPDVAYLPVSIFGTWQQTRLTQDPSHPRISGLIQVCCLPCIEFIKGGTSELMSTCLSFWSTRSTVCDNNHHIWIHVVCKWDKPQWPATKCYK